jgi:hypothetical protein
MLMRISNNRQMATSLLTSSAGALLLCATLFLSGCGAPRSISLQGDHEQTESVETVKTQIVTMPGLYAVFDDKSRSVKSARIAPVEEQDLAALINILRQTGGELAFGLIGESSARPLLRLHIPVPPVRPVMREASNPFERAEQDSALQDKMSEYETKHQRWETEVNGRIEIFLQAARPRLQEPARDRVTDISSALDRAEIFLNEPGEVWPTEKTHRYIIMNSDGIATANRKPVEIKSGARLLLINGSGSTGTLASLQPVRFESKQAALDFIAATEIGRNR